MNTVLSSNSREADGELSSILIFSKVPGRSAVKTRLFRESRLEETASRSLALAIFADSLALCDGLPNRIAIASEPQVSIGDLHELLAQVPHPPKLLGLESDFLFPQRGDSFEERLSAALLDLRSRQEEKGLPSNGVIVLGSDAPSIPSSSLLEADAALRAGEAVLGPCFDGGVYLIGLPERARAQPRILQSCFGSETETEVVSLAKAFHASDIPLRLLPFHTDIDVPEDLAHLVFQDSLAKMGVSHGLKNNEQAENTLLALSRHSIRLVRDRKNNRNFLLEAGD